MCGGKKRVDVESKAEGSRQRQRQASVCPRIELNVDYRGVLMH